MESLLPSQIPVWLYRLLAIFPMTGMIGVDHFALGSKETGMAKALVNLLTFGSWYFFDIAQSFNPEKLEEEGLEIPFYGSAGIGLGHFGEGFSNSFWIRLMCMFAGFMIAGFAGIFTTRPNPVGGAAKAIAGTAGAIAVSIGGYMIYSSFQKAIPTSLTSLPLGVPNPLSGMSGLLMRGGGVEEPGISLVELFTLGTLAALTLAGFVLHNVRNSV
jgi:hypothetical protein